jgi:hypothetical protein
MHLGIEQPPIKLALGNWQFLTSPIKKTFLSRVISSSMASLIASLTVNFLAAMRDPLE